MLLCKPRAADAPLTFSAYAQDLAVTRYLTWRPHADIAETRAVIDRFLAVWERQEEFCWLLFTSDSGQMIGSIAARTRDDGFNLGFLLARSHWGSGYMPEAIAAVVDWAFTQPWVSRVWAACDVENHSSPGRWKRLDSAARAYYPSFQFISTSPQILVIATPMPSPAVSKWEGVVCYQFSGGGQQAVQLCPISCRIGCFARYSLRRA
jgi:ribosomal-protein-alanine N-acetyltransferase